MTTFSVDLTDEQAQVLERMIKTALDYPHSSQQNRSQEITDQNTLRPLYNQLLARPVTRSG